MSSAISSSPLSRATEFQSGLVNGKDLRNLAFNGDAIYFRNKIHNGAMTVKEYGTMSRWNVKDNNNRTTLNYPTNFPSGFSNAFGVKISTTSSGEEIYIYQQIPSIDTQDLMWGTSSAKKVTLSFWVQSSATGTFGGSLGSGGFYDYLFSFTISAANTWEYKTVTISGLTGISTDNSKVLELRFSLGGSSQGAASTWIDATQGSWDHTYAPTGSKQLTSILNSTFSITGVQLESGTIATPFEHRPHAIEESICKKYFQACMFTSGHFAQYSSGVMYSLPVYFSKMASTPTASFTPQSLRWRLTSSTFSSEQSANISINPYDGYFQVTQSLNSTAGFTENTIYRLSGAMFVYLTATIE